ncbi:MAG: CHC2 zinc finger domain-containing protein [Chloroflexi bacterium]|nr:CHC2 zinc finger domain-containing protein [Chloroflexota bacterium]
MVSTDKSAEEYEDHEWIVWELTTAYILGSGCGRVLRKADNRELRRTAVTIAEAETGLTPVLLDLFGLPQLASPSYWVTEVLPAIRKELRRRTCPPKKLGPKSPIAQLKAENRVEDVAGQSTNLRRSGSHLRGKCPLHREQKGESFHVWQDAQRWWCFGRCNRGGDVVDLMQALGRQEVL